MSNISRRSNMNKKGLINMSVTVASVEHQHGNQTRQLRKEQRRQWR